MSNLAVKSPVTFNRPTALRDVDGVAPTQPQPTRGGKPVDVLANLPPPPFVPLGPGVARLPPATLAQLMGAIALYGQLSPVDLSRLQSGAQGVLGTMGPLAQVLAAGGLGGGVDVAALAGAVRPSDAGLLHQFGLLLGMLPGGGKVQQQLMGALEAGVDNTVTAAGGGTFEDRVFSLMQGIIADKQKDIEKRLQDLKKETEDAEKKQSGGGLFGKIFGFASKAVGLIPGVGTAIGAGMNAVGSAFGIGQKKDDTKAESRNLKFEEIKNEMQKLSQMQQALSNILNALNETATGAIRNIGK